MSRKKIPKYENLTYFDEQINYRLTFQIITIIYNDVCVNNPKVNRFNGGWEN